MSRRIKPQTDINRTENISVITESEFGISKDKGFVAKGLISYIALAMLFIIMMTALKMFGPKIKKKFKKKFFGG